MMPGSQAGPRTRRYVLADATQHSLVLLDELGKGTEVNAGAAIAGALLEALDRVGCKARPLPAIARGHHLRLSCACCSSNIRPRALEHHPARRQ